MNINLKSITLGNFKGFKEKKTFYFKKITVLTGANNSGKSTIIQGILSPLQSVKFPLNFSPNGEYTSMGDFMDISYKHKKNNKICLEFVFESKTKNLKKINTAIKTEWTVDNQNKLPLLYSLNASNEYTNISIRQEKNKYLLDYSFTPSKNPSFKEGDKEMFFKVFKSLEDIVKKNRLTNKNKKVKREPNLSEIGEQLYTDFELKDFEIKDFNKLETESMGLHNFQFYSSLKEITGIFSQFNKNTNLISSYRNHPNRTYIEQPQQIPKVKKFGEGYLDQIIAWQDKDIKKFNELNEIANKISLFDSISSHRIKGGRYETLIKTHKKGVKALISDVGFGVSQFLPIIVADLQLESESTLIVAEPEIHLHPNIQAEFADYLIDQIKKNNKNYIIETHSEYLLNRLRLAMTKKKITETDLAIYYLENNGIDTKVHDIKFGEKGEIEGAPNSFFETYYMDVKDIALNSFE